MADDQQKIWDEYFDRIKQRRLRAATLLWNEVEGAGAGDDTVFALDFVHFASSRKDAEDLARQLSQNYAVEISARSEEGYWDVSGTTRPDGICLTNSDHTAWVEFMIDVARSYACVFSKWSLEAPALRKTFRSVQHDDD